MFRIGHLGDLLGDLNDSLDEKMVLAALGTTELAMRDFGVPFQAGSGVAAAIEHFHVTGSSARSSHAA